MKYAFPREREKHIFKKKVLPPEAFNMSVDLLKLKKESMRLDQEKSMMLTSQSKDFEMNESVNYNTAYYRGV